MSIPQATWGRRMLTAQDRGRSLLRAIPTTRPQPEEYATRAEYAWVRKLWKRSHGGSPIVTLAIAFIFGAWTGSQVLLWLLVAFAVVAHIVARNRP